MLNVIILTLEFSIAGKCFFLGSFIWRFSCDFLTVFGGEVNWRGYAQTSFQIRAQRIFGAVPLGLQENAKGGEAWTQLATLKQVSTLLQRILLRAKRKPCPENQSPGSESWSVLCTGGSAGAALRVEDVAVLRDEKGISSAA